MIARRSNHRNALPAKIALAGLLFVAIAAAGISARAATLQDIRSRGDLRCGVHIEKPGFSVTDSGGRISGFDIDFCRAIAAAIGIEARFTTLSPQQRFTALTTGTVDVLLMTTTQTMARDTTLGVEFPFINFYGGGMFMVRRASGVRSARELNGATICLSQGTTADQFISDYFRRNNIAYRQVMYERLDDGLRAYVEGRCDVFTQDDTSLAAMRASLRDPQEHVILPEVLSKEPVGAVVRNNDPQFAAALRWIFAAIVNAEEAGVTQASVADLARTTQDPELQRMFGRTGSLGADAGLPVDWAVRAIQSAGNYGEIFERHLGRGSRFGMPRGVNDIWTRGGLIYGMPIR